MNRARILLQLFCIATDSAFHYMGLYFIIVGYLHHDPFKLALGGIFFIESTLGHIYNQLYFKDK